MYIDVYIYIDVYCSKNLEDVFCEYTYLYFGNDGNIAPQGLPPRFH
jgi:hypothetical protein